MMNPLVFPAIGGATSRAWAYCSCSGTPRVSGSGPSQVRPSTRCGRRRRSRRPRRVQPPAQPALPWLSPGSRRGRKRVSTRKRKGVSSRPGSLKSERPAARTAPMVTNAARASQIARVPRRIGRQVEPA